MCQRRQPDDLIFVDDQSTDESVFLARSLLSNCTIAKVVENPKRLGTVGALNAGLKLAQSDYVLFLSSNDFILPDLLARANACLNSIPLAGVWSAMTRVVDERRSDWLYPSPVIAQRDAFFPPATCRELAYKLGNWFAAIIFNRKALLEIGGFDETLEGLTDFFAALVLASRYGAAFSPVPLRMWRVHDNSLLSRTLCNKETMAAVVQRFRELGTQLAPELFTPPMLARTELRIHFASLRASNGGTLPYVMTRLGTVRRAATRTLVVLMLRKLRGFSLGLIFCVMRPFDLIPMVWYRMLGSSLVRFRELWFGHWHKESEAIRP
jgi:glycosyltransferase involved in cell wall biosynthesis